MILQFVLSTLTAAAAAPARAPAKASPKPVAAAPKAAPAGDLNAMKRALASTGGKTPRDPARLDPNAALEVRGQSRTLSMMLVLKNGKEAINFIRVRKDYRPEITTTPY